MKTKKTRLIMDSDDVVGTIFISPWIIGFIFFIIIPMAASLYLSFTRYDMLSAPKWVGLENYARMLSDVRYWNSVKATFYFVFASVPLKLAFALIIALIFNSRRKMVGVYRSIYYFPSIIGGSVAVAVMWQQIFGVDGALNAILQLFGINIRMSWLGEPETAIWTLIALAVWQFGSPMLIFLAGLKQIPASLYEAAQIDGAGSWQKFWKVTLPMLSPVIFFNLIMQIIAGFMTFTQSFVITGGGPLDTTLFYSVYLYVKTFTFFDMGYGSAMAWVLLIIIALLTSLTIKSSAYWVHYESKGNY